MFDQYHPGPYYKTLCVRLHLTLFKRYVLQHVLQMPAFAGTQKADAGGLHILSSLQPAFGSHCRKNCMVFEYSQLNSTYLQYLGQSVEADLVSSFPVFFTWSPQYGHSCHFWVTNSICISKVSLPSQKPCHYPSFLAISRAS